MKFGESFENTSDSWSFCNAYDFLTNKQINCQIQIVKYNSPTLRYSYIYCLANVSHWRGVWSTWDVLTGRSWRSGVTSTAIGVGLLICTRTVKILGKVPPMSIYLDTDKEIFQVDTWFRQKKVRDKHAALALAIQNHFH